MNLARIGNKYLADTEPWKWAKTDLKRVGTILNLSLQLAANLAIVFEPFLPFTAQKLRDMLSMTSFQWDSLGQRDLLPVGHQTKQPELLFEKIELDAIDAQIRKLRATKEQNTKNQVNLKPLKETVSFETFSQMDIRTGTILEAALLPKTAKLMKLTIDTGLDRRTVVSGIADNISRRCSG
jgi:methionyl-tRNA synthetase